MADHTLRLDGHLQAWLRDFGTRESAALAALREETRALPEVGHWAMPPEEGQFVGLLAKLIDARQIVELGTFTGYGTLWLAQTMPDADIISCERHGQFAMIARRHWAMAGVADRIDLRMTDALDLLDELLATGKEGTIDLILVDADKKPYPDYYDRAIRLVRSGGLVLLDNAFRGGGVADRSDTSKATAAIRTVTRAIHNDGRVDMTIAPVADGLIIARKR